MEFEARLQRSEKGDGREAGEDGPEGGHSAAPLRIALPAGAREGLGAARRISVRGTLNGVPFRSVVVAGEGAGWIDFDPRLGSEAGVREGDVVRVTMEADPEPRVVAIPGDLRSALRADAEAGRIFEELPYSHRKEYVEWIEEAKRDTTRAGRVARTLAMLRARASTGEGEA